MPATAAPSAPDAVPAVLLPAEAFFVRRITLDPAADAAAQVELALETSAPFAVPQLYHGFLRAPDGASALVFATHRRIFAEADWDHAPVVLPAFVVLLGRAPAAPAIHTWSDGDGFVVTGWDGGPMPAVVLARRFGPEAGEAARDELVAEARRRLGHEASVQAFAGAATASVSADGLVIAAGGGNSSLSAVFDVGQLDTMDVRDKAVLAERRRLARRDHLLWRVLLGAAALLALSAVLEGGRLLLRGVMERQRAAQREVATEVARIQTAQTLGTRIEELVERRLRAFEMLTVINQVRPAGLVFTRTVTNGRDTLEVEGQSANSDHVGTYETALRALPQLTGVEFPDVRLRDGLTTFQFTVKFKDGALTAPAGGTAP